MSDIGAENVSQQSQADVDYFIVTLALFPFRPVAKVLELHALFICTYIFYIKAMDPLTPKTLWGLLSRAAQSFPRKGLIIHDDINRAPTRLTYFQLYNEAKVSLP